MALEELMDSYSVVTRSRFLGGHRTRCPLPKFQGDNCGGGGGGGEGALKLSIFYLLIGVQFQVIISITSVMD